MMEKNGIRWDSANKQRCQPGLNVKTQEGSEFKLHIWRSQGKCKIKVCLIVVEPVAPCD